MSTVSVIKLGLEGDFRLMRLGENPVLDELRQRMIEAYSSALFGTAFDLMYRDEEGDAVTIDSQEALELALESVVAQNATVLRVELIPHKRLYSQEQGSEQQESEANEEHIFMFDLLPLLFGGGRPNHRRHCRSRGPVRDTPPFGFCRGIHHFARVVAQAQAETEAEAAAAAAAAAATTTATAATTTTTTTASSPSSKTENVSKDRGAAQHHQQHPGACRWARWCASQQQACESEHAHRYAKHCARRCSAASDVAKAAAIEAVKRATEREEKAKAELAQVEVAVIKVDDAAASSDGAIDINSNRYGGSSGSKIVAKKHSSPSNSAEADEFYRDYVKVETIEDGKEEEEEEEKEEEEEVVVVGEGEQRGKKEITAQMQPTTSVPSSPVPVPSSAAAAAAAASARAASEKQQQKANSQPQPPALYQEELAALRTLGVEADENSIRGILSLLRAVQKA